MAQHKKINSPLENFFEKRTPIPEEEPLVPCCSSEKEVLGKSKIDEIFKNMDILVNKEIKRNNSSLLPPLQQKVNSEKQ